MKSTLPKSLKSFIVAMMCYPFALAAAWGLQIFVHRFWALSCLATLLPVVPCAFAMIYFARGIGEMDELQRRIQLEALAFSLGGVVLAGVTVGMMTAFGFDLSFSLPFWWASLLNGFLGSLDSSPNWAWISALAAFLWGIGLFFASRRYQ